MSTYLQQSHARQTFMDSSFKGYARYEFEIEANAVTIVEPKTPAVARRWIWVAECFNAFPAFDLEMLERGWWIAFYNVGNTFGCPTAMARFDVFYRDMTRRYGFHAKPVLEGISRGGLYVYNWAANNAGSVGLIYGDNPVCDFKSWPGGFGHGPGSPDDWANLLKCYEFKSDQEALSWQGNPVDNIAPIVNAGVPLVHVYGDADEVVPWSENTGALAKCVEVLGSQIKLFVKQGGRHHPHGPEDPSVLADWVLEHSIN